MLGQHLGDGRRQGRLAMIDVTDRPHIHVRLIPFKFLFRHCSLFVSLLDVSQRY
jgi:hypothetical protein